MLRVAINGCGRIGRCLVWAIHERGLQEQIQLVAINDLVAQDILAHLLRHDSTHGHFKTPVTVVGDQLRIGEQSVLCLAEKDPAQLPWKSLGVDVVLECTGNLKQRSQLEQHLQAGAGRVLVAYPVAEADRTLVYGVNHHTLTTEDRIISNASCTTNCLAPIVQVLDQAFGLEQGQMTTIHSYTNDQNLVDKAHSDPYRARAAAVNLIPSKTGAADAVGLVLPHLKGRLDGMAVRVPTLNVSMVDLHALLREDTTVEAIDLAMQAAADNQLAGVLQVSHEPLVSSDFNHNPLSAIYDATQTRVMGRQVKVIAWYDNEWGFSNRMLDVLGLMAP
ncbi:MAG: type I glyceraldehyde-3-phosphate dehydrogenase [Halomonadaceae bacterium]|nr:MAG: type I glyceraldehyde-3-phosphate dehydrogenase [Halomonadaceae bacterium]